MRKPVAWRTALDRALRELKEHPPAQEEPVAAPLVQVRVPALSTPRLAVANRNKLG
ncbi:MAG: hypothetical protein WA137_08560 [Methanothrix sp.]